MHEGTVACVAFVYSYAGYLIFLVAFWIPGSAIHATAAKTVGPCLYTGCLLVFSS